MPIFLAFWERGMPIDADTLGGGGGGGDVTLGPGTLNLYQS